MAEPQNKLEVIKKEMTLMKPTFEQLNLNGLNFAKEVEFATQMFAKNTYLQGAHPASVRNAIVNAALTGISLNPVLKFGYIIPRKEKQVLMALLEPSYMGLIKILTDTGSVAGMSATIVYEKEVGLVKMPDGTYVEKFQIQQGIGGWVKHQPYIGIEHPGKMVACYSIAILPGGLKHVELLRPFEWEDIMQRSESVKNYNKKKAANEYVADPTWLSDPGEMVRKTCIKKHYKYLPKTERAEQIGAAIDLDNQVNGIDFEHTQAGHVDPITEDITYDDIPDDEVPPEVKDAILTAPRKSVIKEIFAKYADQPDLQEKLKPFVMKRYAEIDLAILQAKNEQADGNS